MIGEDRDKYRIPHNPGIDNLLLGLMNPPLSSKESLHERGVLLILTVDREWGGLESGATGHWFSGPWLALGQQCATSAQAAIPVFIAVKQPMPQKLQCFDDCPTAIHVSLVARHVSMSSLLANYRSCLHRCPAIDVFIAAQSLSMFQLLPSSYPYSTSIVIPLLVMPSHRTWLKCCRQPSEIWLLLVSFLLRLSLRIPLYYKGPFHRDSLGKVFFSTMFSLQLNKWEAVIICSIMFDRAADDSQYYKLLPLWMLVE